jgi:beta-galactosidase
VTQTFGFRAIEISEKKGFLLNGKPYPIRGVNRHQEKRDKGWALTAADDELDLRLIQEMGATAIRLAHYPQSERFHDLCDRAGILLWDEVPFVNDVPTSGANIEQQLREMIAQRRNHPSIFCWGIFNEIQRRHSEAAVPFVRRLNELAHELDPSRFTVAASHGTGFPSNFIVERQCYNVYPGWYHGEPDDIVNMLDERFAELGKRRFAISEYGAGGNPAQHEEGAVKKPVHNGPWHPEEWQCHVHEREWRAFQNNPMLWGTFLWVMFDFAVDSRNEGGTPGLNDKGTVTHDRQLKKDVYFFYQANWTTRPMVYIASRRMTPRQQTTTEVKVYSNCPEVELKVNGRFLGKAKPDNIHVFRWENVPLQPGPNVIEASGRGASDRCEWVLQ